MELHIASLYNQHCTYVPEPEQISVSPEGKPQIILKVITRHGIDPQWRVETGRTLVQVSMNTTEKELCGGYIEGLCVHDRPWSVQVLGVPKTKETVFEFLKA